MLKWVPRKLNVESKYAFSRHKIGRRYKWNPPVHKNDATAVESWKWSSKRSDQSNNYWTLQKIRHSELLHSLISPQMIISSIKHRSRSARFLTFGSLSPKCLGIDLHPAPFQNPENILIMHQLWWWNVQNMLPVNILDLHTRFPKMQVFGLNTLKQHEHPDNHVGSWRYV